MDSISAADTLAPTSTFASNDATSIYFSSDATSTFSSSDATLTTAAPLSTIAPYATMLNGVNQDLDKVFQISLWWSLGGLALLILLVRLWVRASMHLRRLMGMGLEADSKSQNYYRNHRSNYWWKFKKYVLYAPLGKTRHNREIRLSAAMHMGCVPSRFHTILIILFWISNIAYCLALDYSKSNGYAIVAELRGRTGVLSIINMIALIILAGRNNPLIAMLQISFDTYNLMHRWIGRAVVVEALIHTFCWAYVKHAAAGWDGIGGQLTTDPFISWGLVATVGMVAISILSLSPIRHAFYETFLDIHIILAMAAMLGILLHCSIAKLPQEPYIKIVIILWALDRIARMCRLAWDNYSVKYGKTQAFVLALPGEACRVTMYLPKKLNVNPGSHAYLRFMTLKPWESHPFSIAWVEHKHTLPELPITEKPGPSHTKQSSDSDTVTEISFVIQAQTGMTRRLYDKAIKCRKQGLTLTAWLEGPYGGHHSLDSYGHVVLFAGASGITHQIPFIKHLVSGFHNRTIATRKIVLVWIVRDSETFEWVRPWMEKILALPGRRECLTIKLFVTRPKNPRDVQSPSKTVRIMSGRPKLEVVLGEEVREQVGAMAVSVCGPGSLQDGIREAVRGVQHEGVVDYFEESFTW